MKKIITLTIALLITACAPSQETIQTAIAQTQSAYTPIPTQTPYPTHTAYPTYTPIPVTNTPTVPPIFETKTNGFYLVNSEIAPGVWKSNGDNDDCYWATTSSDGDIIDNHFGQAGGTAYISPEAFQVEFNDCGTWTYLQGP